MSHNLPVYKNSIQMLFLYFIRNVFFKAKSLTLFNVAFSYGGEHWLLLWPNLIVRLMHACWSIWWNQISVASMTEAAVAAVGSATSIGCNGRTCSVDGYRFNIYLKKLKYGKIYKYILWPIWHESVRVGDILKPCYNF